MNAIEWIGVALGVGIVCGLIGAGIAMVFLWWVRCW